MRILIVGAGIAGLSIAGLLKQRGYRPVVIEKAHILGTIGYSIGIWNNGRRVLQELGIVDEFDKKGYALPEYSIANGKGEILKLYHFEEFVKNYWPPRVQISRVEFHALLRKAAGNISVRTNTTIKSLHQNTENVEVVFNNGKKGVFDVVIGADGIHSQVRNLVFGPGHVNYLGWRGWFFWIDKSKYPLPKGDLEVWEPREFFGVFPHGDNKACAYLAMPFSPGSLDPEDTRIQRLKNHFKKITWVVPEILADIKNPHDLYPSDLAEVKLDAFYKKRVVLLGDAAHAMEPFGGMGASMAMEDALVLTEELSQVDANSVPLALERYFSARKDRIRIAQKQTREIWKWTKMESPVLRFIRDRFVSRLPTSHFTKGLEHLLKDPI